jgi:hypothetical protein
MSDQLCAILRNYIGRYGIEAAYKRLNNRTVSQIVAEYKSDDVEPLAAGEVEGVRYELYDAPLPGSGDGEQESDE